MYKESGSNIYRICVTCKEGYITLLCVKDGVSIACCVLNVNHNNNNNIKKQYQPWK